MLDPAPLVARLVGRARRAASPAAVIAAGFHEALGRAAAAVAAAVPRAHGLDAVVLTGGVFQNAPPHRGGRGRRCAAAGLAVLVHQVVPPNDGGISVGQAAIAAFAY